MKRRPFAERHPLWFVALLELAVTVVYGLTGAAAQVARLPEGFVSVTANVVLGLLAAGLLVRLGWWRAAGYTRPVRSRDLLWFLPLLLPVAFSVAAGTEFRGLTSTAGLLVSALLIGFTEETIFRGLMLTALRGRGVWTAVIVTSVLFGGSHVLNLLSGQSGAQILVQVAYALAVGFCFAAVAVRTAVIWPLVPVHALIDFASFAGRDGAAPAWDAAAGIGLTVAFAFYGLFLMRGRQRPVALAIP